MKPFITADFAVTVTPRSREQPELSAGLYDDMYTVTLGHQFCLDLMPAIDRSPPWPPVLPENVDVLESVIEVRRAAFVLARYVLSPGFGPAEIVDETVVFGVTTSQFDTLVREAAGLAVRTPGVHDDVAPSELRELAPTFHAFLVERFLPSPHVRASDRAALGIG